MAKRSASSELTRDNWDEDNEKEEAGSFKPATVSELQNRTIRKAKRNLNSSSGSLQGDSPFAQFAGFSFAASAFPLKKSTEKLSNSPFSAASEEGKEKANGNSVTKPEKNTEELTKDSKVSISSTYGSSSTTASDNEGRSIEFYRQLKSLNQSVLKWMQIHLEKNSCSDFTPVFNDYKKHLDTLNVTYPVRKKENSGLKNSDLFKNPSSSNNELSQTNDTNKKLSKSSGFQKVNNNSGDETDYGAHFSSNTTNTSTFSFGIKSTPTATSSITPSAPTSSSKEGEENEKKTTPEFSFGFFNKPFQSSSDKPFTFAVTPKEKSSVSGENEDQEYVPPKNEFVTVTEEDAFYSKRCKLFFKKGEGYAEKGVGTLYLKSLEGKTQLLIRADTNLGNILLNIMLSASLPMSKTGKNNVLLVCIPNPPLEAKNPDSKEAIPTLIRVKTPEDADELLEKLNKHKS